MAAHRSLRWLATLFEEGGINMKIIVHLYGAAIWVIFGIGMLISVGLFLGSSQTGGGILIPLAVAFLTVLVVGTSATLIAIYDSLQQLLRQREIDAS
jgi:hypothetical protein